MVCYNMHKSPISEMFKMGDGEKSVERVLLAYDRGLKFVSISVDFDVDVGNDTILL